MASGKWRRQTFIIALSVGLAAAGGGAIGVLIPGGTRFDVLATAALAASVAAVAARMAVRRLRGRLLDAEDRYRELQTGVLDVIEEKQGLELLLSSMEEAVLLLDLEGRILRTNATAMATLFPDELEVAGKLLREVVNFASLQTFVRRAMDAPGSTDGETAIHDGEEHQFLARGTPILSDGGKRVATLIVLHEVTRLRQLERVRTDFVANVSHELKTPITTIRGAVETLQDGALEDPDNARGFLDMIGRQSTRLQAIVDDLLNLTRLESIDAAGEARLSSGVPAAIIEGAVDQCQPAAIRRNIELCCDITSRAQAMCNDLLLEQAVVNLIVNAIKYTESGGRVEVKVEERGALLALSVKDNGPGIAARHQDRVFERFYRIDKGRSREAGGTGLGLAIVKHVVQLHRGKIRLISEVGSGSEFIIILPIVAT